MKKKNAFEIPFRKGSVSWATAKALLELGANKPHPYYEVKARIKENMQSVTRLESNAWDVFEKHKHKNAKTAKDSNGRILDSIRLHQKMHGSHKSGLKLAQVGACLDLLMKNEEPMVRLRINMGKDIMPIDEWDF